MDQWIKQLLQGEISWCETPKPTSLVTRSAFLPYTQTPRIEIGMQSAASSYNNGVGSGNTNKKMIEFLRKSWQPTTTQTKNSEKERSFRHMMNERMRREKQKKSYFALHSMLPLGTKNDKSSIVQTATMRVQELESQKKHLKSRNLELQSNLSASHEEAMVKVSLENPTSGIDSMLEVLNCLKTLDSKPRMIQSEFTNQEFLAVMHMETKNEATEVEKAVNRRFQEAATKRKVQEQWSWTRC